MLSVLWYIPRAARLRAIELVVTPERVVRARMASDPPSRDVLIYDFEGELFFGAAPDLDRYLYTAKAHAERLGIRYLVLRLKRVRNPDVVALERLDLFLQQTRPQGLTTLLAGVRPERHPTELVFQEEDEDFSATLKAIRKAYTLESAEALPTSDSPTGEPRAESLEYYLV
jgi:sulfate permease, SulP family